VLVQDRVYIGGAWEIATRAASKTESFTATAPITTLPGLPSADIGRRAYSRDKKFRKEGIDI
jgi:hypothetical protein